MAYSAYCEETTLNGHPLCRTRACSGGPKEAFLKTALETNLPGTAAHIQITLPDRPPSWLSGLRPIYQTKAKRSFFKMTCTLQAAQEKTHARTYFQP